MLTTDQIVRGAVAIGIAPDPIIPPSAWAADNLVLADGPYAGQSWDLDTTPFWREPLDLLGPESPVNEVIVRKSAQVGYTQMLMAWLGTVADVAAAATLLVLPTIDTARNFNREKLTPTIEASPRLRSRIEDQRSRAIDGSTTLHKRFPGGFLAITGANSGAGLRGKTVKFTARDEIDEWPADLDGQGDPMEMVDARYMAFRDLGTWRNLEGSTPTIDGISRIDRRYLAGDQRVYEVPCPHCGAYHPFTWEQLSWNREPPHRTRHACPDCGALVEHHQKRSMLAGGRWRAQAAGPGKPASFHIDTISSPFVPWDDVVAKYLACGDDAERLKGFHNLWLGRVYQVAGEAPEAERLYERRSDYATWTLPPGVLLLTAGVDVHKDRIELEVVGWGVGKTSWSIGYEIIEGDTNALSTWAALSEFAARSWADSEGRRRQLAMVAVDAGYRSDKVHAWAKQSGNRMAVYGVPKNPLAPPVGTPSEQEVVNRGSRRKRRTRGVLWPVGQWRLKAEFYGLLDQPGPSETGYPPGWCFFPADYDLEHFRRLTSETLVTVQRRGGAITREWQRRPNVRNEQLDCRVYAMAAAYRLGVGQLTADQWAILAERMGVPAEPSQLAEMRAAVADPTAPAAPPASPPPPAPAARKPSGWLGKTSGAVRPGRKKWL